MNEPVVVRRYFYCAEKDEKKHQGKLSAYFVEVYANTNVVARIQPVGLVGETTSQHEINLYALKNNITIAGEWSLTKYRNHQKIRAVLGRDYETS